MDNNTKNQMKIVVPSVLACCVVIALLVGINMNAANSGSTSQTAANLTANSDKPANAANAASSGNAVSGSSSGSNAASSEAMSLSGVNMAESREVVNDDGSRTVTVTYADGSTATITIKNEDGSAQQVSQGQGGSGTGAGGQSSGESATGMTYEAYCALSGDEQYAYYQSFASTADFFAWYNAAKAAYQEANPSIEIGSGAIIDLGGK